MNWVAKLGQNMQFVAFCAHFSVAALVVENLQHRIVVASIITVLAAIKEFWFDAKYETTPPQTMWDNVEDFAGYLAGAWIGVVL